MRQHWEVKGIDVDVHPGLKAAGSMPIHLRDLVRSQVEQLSEYRAGQLLWEHLDGDYSHAELWYFPDDHGPTVNTGIELVLVYDQEGSTV